VGYRELGDEEGAYARRTALVRLFGDTAPNRAGQTRLVKQNWSNRTGQTGLVKQEYSNNGFSDTR
jgi:hypothetical protein